MQIKLDIQGDDERRTSVDGAIPRPMQVLMVRELLGQVKTMLLVKTTTTRALNCAWTSRGLLDNVGQSRNARFTAISRRKRVATSCPYTSSADAQRKDDSSCPSVSTARPDKTRRRNLRKASISPKKLCSRLVLC